MLENIGSFERGGARILSQVSDENDFSFDQGSTQQDRERKLL